MFQKPTFGSTATSSFGSFNAGTSASSPFGGFKPTTGTSAFGAPPAFGAAANTQTNTGGGLFGASNTSGGLFGNTAASTSTPAFGSTSGGFGFGSTAPAAGFGSNVSSGLFGATQNTSAFGAKPAGFGFGSTPTAGTTTGGLFGATPTAGTGLFGQQNNSMTGGGLFSNTTGGAFGQASAPGTAHVKYSPVVGTDVVVKGGNSQNINIKHHCITCMKEYENKSLEELRLEDYQAGRKGAPSGGMFGGGFAAQVQETKPLFSGTTFGQPATTTVSSVFGGSSLGTSTGFGQTNTFSFGGNTQNTANTSLFGANKPAFGATGTTGTGLFGATTSTQAPTFGTNTSTFGFGATTQNQTGGLFGAKPATSGFGTTPANTSFGGFSGGGLFQAKPAQPAPTQPAFGNLSGGFGTATSTAGGGLFGQNTSFGKPVAPAPAFGFSQPTLGTGLGGGLNANQAKPAVGGFGTLGGGGLFQQPQQNNMFSTPNTGLGTGMFGGNTSLGAPSLGLGLNNNASMNNSGLSGASAAGNVHEQMLTLAARPYGDSPLFKDLVPTDSTSLEEVLKPTNPAAVAAVVAEGRLPPSRPPLRLQPRPLPNDKKSLFDGLEESDASLEDKLSLKPSRKRLVLRPNAVSESQNNEQSQNNRSLEEHRTQPQPTESSRPDPTPQSPTDVPDFADGGKRSSVSEQRDNAESNTDKNNSWLNNLSSKLWNDKEKPIDSEPTPRLYPSLDKEMQTQTSERRASWLTTKPLRKPLVSNPDSAENSVRELGVRSTDNLSDKENIDTLSVEGLRFCSHRGGEVCVGCEKVAHQIAGVYVSEDENVSPREMPPHPAGVKLTRPGYYTIPSLNEMKDYIRPDGSCVVPNLTIGRHKYGNVYYDSPVDVAGLDLDTLVHFLNKEVIIYPEDADKPPVGQGLNKRAIVTLDRVWPRDKTEKRPITDPDRLLKMEYEARLRRVCDKHDTKFIEYRPETGSWVFRVEHFSKYGLTDSDEEDDAPTPEVMKRQIANQALQKAAPVTTAPKPPAASSPGLGGLSGLGGQSGLGGLGGLGLPTALAEDSLFAMHQTSLNLLNGSSKAFEMDTTEDNAEAQSLYHENRAFGVKSPTSELARLENRQSHHVQLMKASLYADTEMEDDVSVSTGDQLVPISVSLSGATKAPSVKQVQVESMDESTPAVEEEMEDDVSVSTGDQLVPISVSLSGATKAPSVKQVQVESMDESIPAVEEEMEDDVSVSTGDQLVPISVSLSGATKAPSVKQVQVESMDESIPAVEEDDVSVSTCDQLVPISVSLSGATKAPSVKQVQVESMDESIPAVEEEMEDDVSVSTGDQLVPISVSLSGATKAPSVKQVQVESMDESIPAVEEVSEQPMRPLIVQPHTIVLKYHRKVPPFKETLAGRLDAACIADMSICRARHSRVGFAPGNKLAFVTSRDSILHLPNSAQLCDINKYVQGRTSDDWSEPVVATMALAQGDSANYLQEALSRHLETLLEFSDLCLGVNGTCPKLTVRDAPSERRRLLAGHLRDAANLLSSHDQWGVSSAYCLEVWKLCDALWGDDLDNDGLPGTDDASIVGRHRKFLSWITDAVAEVTDKELAAPSKGEKEDEEDGHSSRIWTLLLGGRLLAACKLAREHGDLNMAAMLAHASGDPASRNLISRQLSLWRECGADTLIASHRLEALRLVAGEAKPLGKLVEVDWMRALHATARYLCPQVPSLERVVKTYEDFFIQSDDGEVPDILEGDEMGMQPPLPPYMDQFQYQENGRLRKVLDLRYELIRARATNSRPKLRPAAYTPDPLDYSLCFLLGTWFGSPTVDSITGVASQLEACGLWHLAIQALFYHPDTVQRGHLVRGVLSRHAPSTAHTADLKARLQLLNKLQLPEKWLLTAQAHRAKYEHLPAIEAEHLAGAGHWNTAHKILMDELMPTAVLSDDLKSIAPLLEKLHEAASRDEVSEWESGGLALYHYLHLCEEIRGLVSWAEAGGARGAVAGRLAALRPQVVAAARALANTPARCGRFAAARTEMGARLVQLLVAGGASPHALGSLLQALKLPPGAAQPALRQMTTELAEQASDSCIESVSSSPRSSHHRSAIQT